MLWRNLMNTSYTAGPSKSVKPMSKAKGHKEPMDFSDFKNQRDSMKENESKGCQNIVHKKSISFTKYCSSCGELVNRKFDTISCDEFKHARMKRREKAMFCTDCGVKLIECYI